MLFKKLIRTALNYKAQFISMIIMVAIGVGVFVGFNIEWNSINENTTRYFENTNFADYRIISENGFNINDIEKINNISNVDAATRFLTVNMSVKNSNNALAINVIENYGEVTTFILSEGIEYDSNNSDGIWLSDKYALSNDIKVGDDIILTYKNIEITNKVVGLIKCSEYMVCVADDNQLMPDYTSFGYGFITPKKIVSILGAEFYTQINIKSDLSKEEMEEAVQNTLAKSTLVLSNDENLSFSSAESEMEEGKTMGSLLPVLFLLIGVLTMVTTMHRIATNEKKQIGILKALGFRDKKILFHYTSYGLVIGVLGTIIGIGLGFIIARIIISPSGMMSTYFDLPSWKLYMPWFCYVIIVLIIFFLTFISYLSVKKMLQGTASETLNNYTSKKMKQNIIEKTKLWNRLLFGTKWNIRDILRHKTRSLMTLVGIISCMLLLVGGLGMKDSMDGFMDLIVETNDYNTKINITETADNYLIENICQKYDGDWQSTTNVRFKEKNISLEIYNINQNHILFINKDNKVVNLNDNGVYICIRLADMGIKKGDIITFVPYGSNEQYSVKVEGILRSLMTENIVMTNKYADSINLHYNINTIYTDKNQNEVVLENEIASIQSKQTIIDSYDNFMEIMNTMILVLVLCAIVIGIVVLYNLGIMSYVERKIELATLKVVGFRDKHIGKLLINQNVWLTIIGIIVGLPAGIGVLQLLLITLGNEYELKMVVGVLTYSISITLTFGVSLIVSFFVSRKNKQINMIEALKGTE